MKFALVMPCWPRTEERFRLADQCFASLLKTEPIETTPLVILLYKHSPYRYPLEALRQKFWLIAREQCHEGRWLEGVDQPMVYGSGLAFEYGADYIVHLGEDTLFHPRWLIELTGLIRRHPDARAWSIYRSAHTAVHATLAEDGQDVLVRSINGNGITLSREEWAAWGLYWTQGTVWNSANGTTIDMHHLSNRAGPRWVTRVSYIEHTGRSGAHAQPHIPEWAQEFQGAPP